VVNEEETLRVMSETMKAELNADPQRKRLRIFEKITLTKSNKKKNKKVAVKKLQ
jgi:hypothetical protein